MRFGTGKGTFKADAERARPYQAQERTGALEQLAAGPKKPGKNDTDVPSNCLSMVAPVVRAEANVQGDPDALGQVHAAVETWFGAVPGALGERVWKSKCPRARRLAACFLARTEPTAKAFKKCLRGSPDTNEY